MTSIPYHDFGGDGPLLHLSHSNGFPPECFRQLVDPLLAHYHVIGVYHRPLWPGSRPEEVDSWRVIAGDTIRFFEQQNLRNVIGVGHSLGAVTTMYAALERPSLFRALVLVEPIFMLPQVLEMMATAPEFMERVPLVQNTRNRRRRWPSYQAAFEHFRDKDVFKYWPDAALWDYVNHALHEDESGKVVLTYTRDWEARIYKLPPRDVWQVIPDITQPTLAIRGAESDALFPQAWQLWQEHQPQATFIEIAEAGHVVPMERPSLVAQTILDFLQDHDA